MPTATRFDNKARSRLQQGRSLNYQGMMVCRSMTSQLTPSSLCMRSAASSIRATWMPQPTRVMSSPVRVTRLRFRNYGQAGMRGKHSCGKFQAASFSTTTAATAACDRTSEGCRRTPVRLAARSHQLVLPLLNCDKAFWARRKAPDLDHESPPEAALWLPLVQTV